jgi:hypothetical protein
LSEKVVLVLLAVDAGAVNHGMCYQGGSRRGGFLFVLSMWVQFLEAGQKRINLASDADSVHGRCDWQSRQGSSW